MADTVAITAGSGTVIGTDEVTIGGTLQHVQRMKLVNGADGGTELIGGDATNGLDVDVTRVQGTVDVSGSAIDATVQTTYQHDVAVIPSLVLPFVGAGIASAAAPTAVSADNDVVNAWYLRNGAAATVLTAAGALIGGDATNGLDVDVTRVASITAGPAPHANGTTIATATAQYTSTQTSTILGPTNSGAIVMYITSIQIQTGGTTAGAVQVYYGTGAYSRGTSRAIFDGEFAPSATLKPGVVMTPYVPYQSVAGDECRVTTSAAINPLTVTIWYYLA